MAESELRQTCPECRDTGWVRSERDPNKYVPCECRDDLRTRLSLERAGIPARYREATLSQAVTGPKENRTVANANAKATDFASAYGLVRSSDSRGLLIQGTYGVGKTHLACAVLNELAIDKKVTVYFSDFALLLNEIKGTFDPSSDLTANDVLRPVLKSDVLLLDDLGSEKASEFVTETLGTIINYRYLNEKPLIVTTNYLDSPETLVEVGALEKGDTNLLRQVKEFNQRRGRTLEERIGGRLRSRLFEMADTVIMVGRDRRKQRHTQ